MAHEHNGESQPVKKRSFRRLSFFKQNNTSKPVINTHILNKEYDVETGNKIINNYMIIKEIGRGVHGKVKLAEDLETGELVAIKIVDKQSRKRQLGYNLNNSDLVESELKIRREIAILKKCLHPNVVKLKEVIDDPTSKKIYLALEYMEGGEILWRDEERDVPVLSMEESRHIFRDVVCGLDYLHYQGIIHRDIKPANLLLSTTENIVKISDFGVSYYNENDNERELLETAGTPAFFAPELCSSIENQQQLYTITKSIDIWALGVTLYCFIYGQCPFTASTEFELFDIIPTQPLHIPTKDEIGFDTPNTLIDLLNKLLEKDPMKRITLEQVKHHPWVIEDLNNPSLWYKQSDPTQYKAVPSIIEYQPTISFMDKLRKSIHRILSSFTSHHTIDCTPTHTPSHTSMTTHTNTTISPLSSHIYPQQEEEQEYRQDKGWIPTSFTKMTLSTSSSEESITPTPPVKKNTLPFAVDRNSSSSSSMSGLVVSFSSRPNNN